MQQSVEMPEKWECANGFAKSVLERQPFSLFETTGLISFIKFAIKILNHVNVYGKKHDRIFSWHRTVVYVKNAVKSV